MMTISKDTKSALLSYMANRGMDEADLYRVIENTVRWWLNSPGNGDTSSSFPSYTPCVLCNSINTDHVA